MNFVLETILFIFLLTIAYYFISWKDLLKHLLASTLELQVQSGVLIGIVGLTYYIVNNIF